MLTGAIFLKEHNPILGEDQHLTICAQIVSNQSNIVFVFVLFFKFSHYAVEEKLTYPVAVMLLTNWRKIKQ